MSAAFTPGPWTCEQSICDGDVCFDIHQVQIDGKWVPGSDVAYSRLFKTYVAEHLEVQQANARLIASAPDLLKALKDLDDAYCSVGQDLTKEDRHQHRMVLMFARAAIAKATGAAA